MNKCTLQASFLYFFFDMEVWKNSHKTNLHYFFRKVLEADPTKFDYDYLLGDLDDFFFKYCTWLVLKDPGGDIKEIVLIYQVDLAHPSVLAFARDRNNVSDLLRLLSLSRDVLPPSFYCHYPTSIEYFFTDSYSLAKNYGVHYKMKFKGINTRISLLKTENFRHMPKM
jgi:hypothetical protein